MIHKDLLCAKSQFFTTKLSATWNNGEHEVYLKDEDPTAFAHLVDWMYSECFPNLGTDADDIWSTAAVYKLADFLVMVKAKNDLIDKKLQDLEVRQQAYTYEGLKLIWLSDARETKLFAMALRSCVESIMEDDADKDDFDGLDDELCRVPTVMLAILKGIHEYRKEAWGAPYDDNKCEYHDHTDNSSCCT